MAAKVNDLKDQIDHSLRDKNKPWTPVFEIIEKKTGVQRVYIFIGAVAALGLWLVFGFAGQLVCNCVGFLYPAYVSIKAIESPQKDDDTKWLTYWVVFSFFSILEFFADIIASWFPLYWLLKCVFMVWLMIPTEFNGSLILYRKVVRPYFLQHQKAIDEVLSSAKETISAAKME